MAEFVLEAVVENKDKGEIDQVLYKIFNWPVTPRRGEMIEYMDGNCESVDKVWHRPLNEDLRMPFVEITITPVWAALILRDEKGWFTSREELVKSRG
jgi:hypothetical protein